MLWFNSAFCHPGNRFFAIVDMNPSTRLQSSALVAAAGQGSRLGLGPKAFLEVGGRSLVELVVANLLDLVDEVVVAAPPGMTARVAGRLPADVRVIEGGDSRQDTLVRLARAARGDLLLFQFVARPFASRALYAAVLTAADRHGAATAGVNPEVPIGGEQGGSVSVSEALLRGRILQTPRAFRRERLRVPDPGWEGQVRVDICTPCDTPLALVPGEETNIKITTALDWAIAREAVGPHLGLC
jgi:2-C-methyl-D-erythritol 4-phosphate cytidylyltransferase